MKKICLLPLLLSFACGGTLSDDQRKKVRQEMENSKIVRVTEAEIMTAALQTGNDAMAAIADRGYSPELVDSLEKAFNVKINWAVPGSANAVAIEQELINAYITGITEGTAQENVQRLYRSESNREFDSLLYSKPRVIRNADGSERLEGIWNIYLAKSDVVKEVSRSK